MSRAIRPTTKYYAGFDLSLTGSGIVILDSTGKVHERHVISVKCFGAERLDKIQNIIRSIISKYKIELVCIEDYAFAAVGKTFHIGELGGVIRLLLFRLGVKFINIKPTSAKKFATGSGGGASGSKAQVTMYVYKNWNFQAIDDNEADAFVLCRIALALHNFGVLEKHQREVIEQINNPEPKKKKKKKEE